MFILFRSLKEKFLSQPSIISIGNFDGLHLGHQFILKTLKQKSIELNLVPRLIFFEPQPAEYFNLQCNRLMHWRDKYQQFLEHGIKEVICLRFNKKIAEIKAIEFINWLKENLQVKNIVIGHDFQFGYKKQGNVTLLQQYFNIHLVEDILYQNQRISSSLIRKAITENQFNLAHTLLGHPYTLSGKVIYGQQLGRKLGFPTANIHTHPYQKLLQGIYIVLVHGISNNPLPGVASLGIRPTLKESNYTVEVHILNYNANLYGRHLSIEFKQKLREEQRFATLKDLAEQIQKDVQATNAFFKHMPNIQGI